MDNQIKADIFTKELEHTRKSMEAQSLTLSPWEQDESLSIPVIKQNVETVSSMKLIVFFVRHDFDTIFKIVDP